MQQTCSRQRVLIVDDVAMNRSILGEALRHEYDIVYAEDGESALELATAEAAPDLILLDIILPGMNGYEVLGRLKASSRTRHIPVVFITVKGEEEHEQRGLELGAVDYISKPFSLPIVRARVRTHLELKRHRDVLEDLSTQDGLTGIPNRRRFDEIFTREFRRAQREGSPLALILVDVDLFKAYNDLYGHLAGDDCLRRVATTLACSLRRPMDSVARYGGEEFAIVLPNTDLQGGMIVAESLRYEVEAMGLPHAGSPHGMVTASLGLSVLGPETDLAAQDPERLFACADKMLYEAKRVGRNAVRGAHLEDAQRLMPE
ncbi:diguanylate cyclase [Megalodesulfovibrio paquesii]